MAAEGPGLAGGCQCGAVRYRLMAEPTGVNVCHCRMCQKASGGPFMVFGGVRLDQLVWTRGEPKVFVSSSIAERGFCSNCGTPLTYRMFEHDRISVTLRFDRDVWQRFLALEESEVIEDRTAVINAWFREKLAELELGRHQN